MDNENTHLYQRAKDAMNRGHRLSRSSPEAAINAYSEAIQILDTLQSTPDIDNSLGAALMNRGQLIHALCGTEKYKYSVSDYIRADQILIRHTNAQSPWPYRNRAGALLNHANLLLDLQRPHEAREKAESALSLISSHSSLTDIELQVLASRTICDAIGQTLPSLEAEAQNQQANLAHEHARRALELIRALRQPGRPEPFPEISERLFRFGAHLLATHRPEALPGFIRVHIDPRIEKANRASFSHAATEAIKLAIDTFRDQLLDPATTPTKQEQMAKHIGDLARLVKEQHCS